MMSLVKSDANTANDSDITLHLILIDGDEDGEDFIGPEEASMEVRSHRANNNTAFKERTQFSQSSSDIRPDSSDDDLRLLRPAFIGA